MTKRRKRIINLTMSVHSETLHVTVKVPFKKGEPERFKAWLEATGRKAGPYLRVIAIEAVESWESMSKTDQAVDLRELLKRN